MQTLTFNTTKREVKAVGYLGRDEPSLVQSY